MTQSILSQIGGKAKTVTVVFDDGLEFDFVANDRNYKKLAEARNELKAVHATMTEAEEDEAQNLDKLKVMIDKGMTEAFGEDAAAVLELCCFEWFQNSNWFYSYFIPF